MEKGKVMSKLLIIISLLSLFPAASAQQLWGTLETGPNKIGVYDKINNNQQLTIND